MCSFNIDEFYAKVAPWFDAALDNLYPTLKSIRKANLCVFFESRVKSLESFKEKIVAKNAARIKEGKPEMTEEEVLREIFDGAGARIIIPYRDKVQDIVNIIEDIPNLQEEIEKRKDYNKKPKPNGYSGYHACYYYKVKIATTDDQERPKVVWVTIPVEIQVRTLAQHIWATYEHKHRYKADKTRAEAGNERVDVLFKRLAKLCDLVDKLVIVIRDFCEETKIAK